MLGRSPPQQVPQAQINSLKFINENRHFIAATSQGFQVCETVYPQTKVSATIPGGTALCDSYKNSNIFFFVGTGTHLDYPTTRLCIWNDRSKQVVGSVQFSPNLQILDLQVLSDWIVVVFSQSIKVFHFAKGFTREKVVAQFSIRKLEGRRSQGQVAAHASPDGVKLTLAFQNAERAGKIDIMTVAQQIVMNPAAAGAVKESFLYASDGREPVTGIAFSQDGTNLHVSAANGTLLNTYNVAKRELIKQLGRGK